MSKRGKAVKRRKAKALSVFGLTRAGGYYETIPLYQQKFQEGDMAWLVDEYQKRRDSDPSLTFEDFAIRYGISLSDLPNYIRGTMNGEVDHSVILWHGTTASRAASICREGFRINGRINGIFFTQTRSVAYGYAQDRANSEDDKPALIMCAIDLRRYHEYTRRHSTTFAFRRSHYTYPRKLDHRLRWI